ncbi:MAG: Sec-independent protein translocase protein TatB [Campylobacterota bacterium]|nr:Sec-independent protein translocase protein TatB [Campylobacterota bacterium]
MFGLGFAEILIIGVIAILFLGPDKLPEAMIEIAKFMKNIKKTITSAKDSIESELHVSEMREEMMSYKKELTSASGELDRLTSLDDLKSEINDIKKEVKVDMKDDIQGEDPTPPAPPKPEVVTFKKKTKPEISDTDV